jgi:hypothetical protein
METNGTRGQKRQLRSKAERRQIVEESLRAGSCSGSIDIDLGHARVRIEGRADPECVRAPLERRPRPQR